MKHIFFDLDGTLWDASKSTAIAWNQVFKKWNLNITITEYDIRSVAGKPYLECLNILAPETLQHKHKNSILEELTLTEKEYMQTYGGEFYPDSLSVIKNLADKHHLYLVSNCNGWYLDAFLEKSELLSVFRETICFTTKNQNKFNNLKYLIEKYTIHSGYYVGDTQGDQMAATQAGLEYIHMTYGFGESIKPSLQFDHFEEIESYFQQDQQ